MLGRREYTASDRHTETSFIGSGLMEMLLSPFGEEKKKKGFKTKKDPILQERQPESSEKTALYEGPSVNERPKSSLGKTLYYSKQALLLFGAQHLLTEA